VSDNIVDFVCDILEHLLVETPQDEFKVSYQGNKATIALPMHVSLEGLNKLSAEDRERVDPIIQEDSILLCVYV
jgi:hypothetical protein